MSRGLWFVVGAGAGAYAVARARRVAESLTVDGVRDRAKGLGVGLRLLREEVAQGRSEKESELRERLGLVSHGRPELGSGLDTAAARPARPPSVSPARPPRGEEG